MAGHILDLNNVMCDALQLKGRMHLESQLIDAGHLHEVFAGMQKSATKMFWCQLPLFTSLFPLYKTDMMSGLGMAST